MANKAFPDKATVGDDCGKRKKCHHGERSTLSGVNECHYSIKSCTVQAGVAAASSQPTRETQTMQLPERTIAVAVAVRKQTRVEREQSQRARSMYASIEFRKRALSRLTPQPRGKEQ